MLHAHTHNKSVVLVIFKLYKYTRTVQPLTCFNVGKFLIISKSVKIFHPAFPRSLCNLFELSPSIIMIKTTVIHLLQWFIVHIFYWICDFAIIHCALEVRMHGWKVYSKRKISPLFSILHDLISKCKINLLFHELLSIVSFILNELTCK